MISARQWYLAVTLLLWGLVAPAWASIDVWFTNSNARAGEDFSMTICASWDHWHYDSGSEFQHATVTISGSNGYWNWGDSYGGGGDCWYFSDTADTSPIYYSISVEASYWEGYTDSGSTGGSVWPQTPPNTIRLTLNSFLPYEWIDDPADCCVPGRYAEGIFDGDYRTGFNEWGSARTTQSTSMYNAYVLGHGGLTNLGEAWAEETHLYDKETSLTNGLSGGYLTSEARNEWVSGPPLKVHWGRANTNGRSGCDSYTSGTVVTAHCWIDIPNGVYGYDPDINYNFNIQVDFADNPWHPLYHVWGCTKLFPAYEVFLNGAGIHLQLPVGGPWDLFTGGCNHSVDKYGRIDL
jgi:hypothetical protein